MSKKVLLVDDDAELCANLRVEIEEMMDCNVDIALNGREAVGMFFTAKTAQPYDLVLLDIKMPHLDGKGVLDVIRKNEELQGILLGRGVPIIMLTGVTTGVPDTFYKGCDDYIVKPFKTSEVLKKVETHLKPKKA